MYSRWITLSLIAGAFLLHGGEFVPKTAGVCFRFDDNKPPKHWQEMGALFEKYGYRMFSAIVSQDLNGKESVDTLKNLSAKGHSMMDHLPNHAVYLIRARNQQEFEEYSKLPIADHADPGSKRIYFKYELNADHPQNKKFQASIQNGELRGFPEKMKGELGNSRKILHPSSGKVYGIRIQNGKKILCSFWGEKITVPDLNNADFVLLTNNVAFQPSDELLRFLATTSRKNFLAAGLPAPRAWIQPGGWEDFITAEKLNKIYGKEFGYISGDSIPGVNANRSCCFNDPDPELQRFCMRNDFTGPDNGQNVAAMKQRIADAIAKRRVKIFISHMWVQRVKGGWEAFIKDYDELLQWLKANNIPVRTQEEWAEQLYTKKPDPSVNIMPSFSTDLDADGKPDGYELLKGATADLKTGIVTIPTGGKLHISDLAGLEKGNNQFALTVKGEKETTVILDFFFVMRSGANYIERKQFRLDGDDWQTIKGTVNVKPQAVTLHYGVSTVGAKSPIELKNPVFNP